MKYISFLYYITKGLTLSVSPPLYGDLSSLGCGGAILFILWLNVNHIEIFHGETFLMIPTLMSPSYSIMNPYELSLKDLLKLSQGEYPLVQVQEKSSSLVLSDDYMPSGLTIPLAFPLMEVFSTPYQGHSQMIWSLYSAMLFASQYENICIMFLMDGKSYYLYKSNKNYLLTAKHWQVNFPFFSIQLTFLMQQLWYLLYHPGPLQLIWLWMGMKSTVLDSIWTKKTWRTVFYHKGLWRQDPFANILQLLLHSSDEEFQNVQAFLQTARGYFRGWPHRPYYFKNYKKESVYWLGYVGEVGDSVLPPYKIHFKMLSIKTLKPVMPPYPNAL